MFCGNRSHNTGRQCREQDVCGGGLSQASVIAGGSEETLARATGRCELAKLLDCACPSGALLERYKRVKTTPVSSSLLSPRSQSGRKDSRCPRRWRTLEAHSLINYNPTPL